MAQTQVPPSRGDNARRRASRRGQSPRRIILLTIAVATALVAGGVALLTSNRGAKGSTNTLASFMGITPITGVRQAPDFTLTDQNGQPVSLDGFRGKAVVLEFMDSHCTDICPIISQEFVQAHRDLGPTASQVAFVAVNVNPWHYGRADVAGFTDNEGLNQVPEWHFVTGPPSQLQPVWKAYGITVIAPNPTADVQHSDTMFFIDPAGNERVVAEPTDDHTANGTSYLPAPQIAEWGHGIATYAAKLAAH